MSRGRFIAFEGGEGAGKSTQARMLTDRLRAEGIETQATREPGGTPGAEAIRSLLLHPPAGGWAAPAEALLFAAARSDHVARLIEPALERGVWVVSDRFVGSSLAYQGGAGHLGEGAVRRLHQIGCAGLLPDLTIYLALKRDMARERLDRRDDGAGDAIESRGEAYHARVAQTFDRLAAEDASIVRIAAEGNADAVHDQVWQAVERMRGS